jgi:hypothetical protein
MIIKLEKYIEKTIDYKNYSIKAWSFYYGDEIGEKEIKGNNIAILDEESYRKVKNKKEAGGSITQPNGDFISLGEPLFSKSVKFNSIEQVINEAKKHIDTINSLKL